MLNATTPTASIQEREHKLSPHYCTANGVMLNKTIEKAFSSGSLDTARGKVNLVLTSPPFPLVHKKKYGNQSGVEYVEWLCSVAPLLKGLLAPDGSIVIEVGNAWEKGSPEMSTLPLEALLAFKKAGDLHLCQHIICHNPARLPSPAQWVNVERCRLKDSFTHIWWLSASPRPKADNRKVLLPYGEAMRKLLKRGNYNSGRRPSGHRISPGGFLRDRGGAIPASVMETDGERSWCPSSLLSFSNTAWDASYRGFCAEHGFPAHPARMQPDTVAFFVQFLTDEGDLVFDPFAGSNTTGCVAEQMMRRWFSIEASSEYALGSRGRFKGLIIGDEDNV